jgi:gamma-glutamylputrescine oxidase
MQLSYWEKDTFFDNTDVVIIGSGIVGLNAAIFLKEQAPSLNIIVVERGPLPSGASTKNAGFACFGSMSELLDDAAQNGEDAMLGLVEKRWKGLLSLREKIGDNKMDYRPLGGHEVFSKHDLNVFEDCAENIDRYNVLLNGIVGSNVFAAHDSLIKENGLNGFNHLIINKYEGQLHTGKMMQTLFKLTQQLGITVLNGLEVVRIEENSKSAKIYMDKGWYIQTKKILVCTNGFTPRLFPALDVKPARNQVLVTAPIPGLKMNGSFHYHKGYVYFRNIEQRILLGGGRHLFQTEETTDKMELTDEIQNFLDEFLSQHLAVGYPGVTVDMRWSGILGVGDQKKPIIQQYSDHIYTALRLGGMGVAIGILVGREGAELLFKGL